MDYTNMVIACALYARDNCFRKSFFHARIAERHCKRQTSFKKLISCEIVA